MTVTSTARRAGPFTGNGVTTAFPFTFKVFSADDLEITHTDADGAATVITTGFSVALNANQDTNPGGTITYPSSGSPMTASETLVAVGDLAYTQTLEISNAGRFLPQSIEDALDRSAIQAQQLDERLDRTIGIPADGPYPVTPLPSRATRYDRFLKFDDLTGQPNVSDFTQTQLASAIAAAYLGAAGPLDALSFIQAGLDAIARTAQDKAREIVSVNDWASLTKALAGVAAGGATLIAPASNIAVAADLTIPRHVTLAPQQGAMITVAAGKTLTVLGEIVAGNYEIFDGDGVVDLDNSASEYNLAWFKTANGYINERWDFACRGMATFRTKVVRIPRPREGQAGVEKVVNRLFWNFSAHLLFTDNQNAMTVYVEGEFKATGDCDAFMLFDDAAKPENIYFYGPIQAIADAGTVVDYGINFRAGSRISFFGQVVLNGFQTPVKMGGTDQTASVEDIYMPRTQFSFFSVAALDIYGKAGFTAQNIRVGNLRTACAQLAGLPVARLRGLLRDIVIDNVYYSTDIPKSGYAAVDAADVVLIESNAEGDIRHCEIGAIFQANATNGLRVQSAVANASIIGDVTVNRIFGKFHGSAAVIDYCHRVTINSVENESDVTVSANASYTTIRHGGEGMRNLTDNGSYTVINGIGHQSVGGGGLPSPAVAWPIGTIIRETFDNRAYIRIANAGAASDFLKIIKGPNLMGTSAQRPVLTAYEAGTLYFDTTLYAPGKPIWYTPAGQWVDGTGAVV